MVARLRRRTGRGGTLNARRRLDALARRLDAQQRVVHSRRSSAAPVVDTSPEHVLEVLRTLRDAGALGEVLKDEGLEADAVALLGMIDAGELNAAELAEW